MSTNQPANLRTKGNSVTTIGNAIAQEIIQLYPQSVINPSNQPNVRSIFTKEIIPLIKNDRIKGTTMSAQRGDNFEIFPMILGVSFDITINSENCSNILCLIYIVFIQFKQFFNFYRILFIHDKWVHLKSRKFAIFTVFPRHLFFD